MYEPCGWLSEQDWAFCCVHASSIMLLKIEKQPPLHHQSGTVKITRPMPCHDENISCRLAGSEQ